MKSRHGFKRNTPSACTLGSPEGIPGPVGLPSVKDKAAKIQPLHLVSVRKCVQPSQMCNQSPVNSIRNGKGDHVYFESRDLVGFWLKAAIIRPCIGCILHSYCAYCFASVHRGIPIEALLWVSCALKISRFQGDFWNSQ